jgi:PAS domain S-box-containing protein
LSESEATSHPIVDSLASGVEALRESEERLQLAIAIETVGVIFFKADGQITEANDAFLRMSGYSREDLAEGLLRWDAMTPPEWMPRSLEAVEELQTTGRTTPYEKEYIRKEGSRWWGLFAATRLGEEESVEFVIDVTGRKRAEAERERLIAHELTARAQAEERRRLSRELHDRVAHDIALVHQSLELHEALKASDPERATAKMELARRTVKEALESTRDLSMELREPEVRRGLEAALANLLRDFVPPTVEASLSVEGEETLVPPEIRNQLFLILREAIRNAVVHSGAGRITVKLDIGSEKVAGCVEDDGNGFDTDEIRTADSGGLRAMEERATLVGTDLEISSALGKGTTVKVSVPLGDA